MSIKSFFHYEGFEKFNKEIHNQNFSTLKLVSTAGAIVSTGLLVFESIVESQVSSFFIYLTWCCICFFSFLFCSFLEKIVKKHVMFFLYIFLGLITLTAIISGTLYFKNNNSVVIIGILCIIPFVLLDKPWRFCIFQILFCTAFCIMSLMVKAFSIALVDCINAIGFTFLSCIFGISTIKMKFKVIESTATIVTQRDTDPLTGLYNRRAGEAIVKKWLQTKSGSAAYVLVDLDNFKEINDTAGHHAGDQALTSAAKAMLLPVRKDDCIARLGGDEFFVFLADIKSLALVKEKIEKIIDSIRTDLEYQGKTFHITASAGITMCIGGEKYDTVYQRADLALYRAKELGRDRFCLFKEEN